MNQQVSCEAEPSACLTPDPEPCPDRLSDRAFEAAMLAERPMLKRWALQLTRDHHRAEDLLQDVMLLGWVARARFDGRFMGAWLRRIMHNRFISLSRRPNLLISMEALTAESNGKSMPFADSALAQDYATSQQDVLLHAAELLDLLGSMPLGSRHALEVKLHDGASDEETAQAMGLPVGTVKSRIFRARARLMEAENPAPQARPRRKWQAKPRNQQP